MYFRNLTIFQLRKSFPLLFLISTRTHLAVPQLSETRKLYCRSSIERAMKDYLMLHLKLMFSEKATKFKLLFLLQQWLWLVLSERKKALTTDAQLSLFLLKSRTFGLGQLNSGAFGVFSANYQHPFQYVHVFHHSTIISTKYLSLYIHIPNIFLVLGFEFWLQRIRDLALACSCQKASILSPIQVFLNFRSFDFRGFQFTAVYNSILFSSPLVLLSNLHLRGFCFRGFFLESPH